MEIWFPVINERITTHFATIKTWQCFLKSCNQGQTKLKLKNEFNNTASYSHNKKNAMTLQKEGDHNLITITMALAGSLQS